MDKPFSITVGIPAYNEEENIANLLNQLLNQKGQLFTLDEILVISDGSTDSTIQKVSAFTDPRVKLFIRNTRKGQVVRQNELVDIKSSKTDLFLLLEADVQLSGTSFIESLVSTVPEDKKFSLVFADTEALSPKSRFEAIVCYGFYFRKRLNQLLSKGLVNLYFCTGPRLFSKEFLSSFHWEENFNEDSFCFRKAVSSGLPIYLSPEAKVYFRQARDLKDYLLQSAKFNRAKKRESQFSGIYSVKWNYGTLLNFLIRELITSPIFLSLYLVLVVISKLYTVSMPEYSDLWEVYQSTKLLQ